jgi:2-keto-4-pentenoate hydratase/2-oxohepta-3-ene-1,7-dioic acid hydratase in catechol pathway
MQIVRFERAGSGVEVGVLRNQQVCSLAPLGYTDVVSFLGEGPDAWQQVHEFSRREGGTPVSEVRQLAPITNPPRIFGIGLNYLDHAAESKMQVQKVPTVFLKLASSIVGPDDNVVLPKNSTQVDYEAEFAVVIGKGGYRIAQSAWREHVFGYTILNDVTARDVQLATTQWNLGKSFPTFTPIGPAIVTSDEVGDPHALNIRLSIDGESLQSANTSALIFPVPALIEYISSIVPLLPGDVISTGTPPGVGLGRTPQRWLMPGEEMVIEIENIGTLRNRTVAEV